MNGGTVVEATVKSMGMEAGGKRVCEQRVIERVEVEKATVKSMGMEAGGKRVSEWEESEV